MPIWLWIALAAAGLLLIGGGGASLAPGQVPDTATPVTPAQLYAALQAAWPSIVGGTPSREALLTLLSQWAFETGGGGKTIQYNIGNFKATSSTVSWTSYMTTEGSGPNTVHVMQNFVAYPDLATGVAAYLSAMYGHFGSAWQYVVDGDPSGFAQALKDAGYYTGSESDYAAGLESWYAQLDAQIPGAGNA
jgi:hypothetical protein